MILLAIMVVAKEADKEAIRRREDKQQKEVYV